MLGTRQRYHRLRHEKILDSYDKSNTYAVVRSLRDTTNFGRLDVQRHMMTLEATIVVGRISRNNKNTAVLSNLFLPYLHESYEQLLSLIEQLR